MVSNIEKIDPAHYKAGDTNIQAIDIIELFELNFAKGSVIKYTLRSGRKSEQGYDQLTKEIEDLEKARWFLDREIERLRKKQS
jgi:cell division protein FtsB